MSVPLINRILDCTKTKQHLTLRNSVLSKLMLQQICEHYPLTFARSMRSACNGKQVVYVLSSKSQKQKQNKYFS